MTAAALASALGGIRRGRSFWCPCPIHESDGKPHRPSLQISDGNHKVLVTCWAGCDRQAVIRKLVNRGLWEVKELPFEDRRRYAIEQRERALNIRLMREYVDTLDRLKTKALNSGNWDDWKALCRAQGKVQRKLVS